VLAQSADMWRVAAFKFLREGKFIVLRVTLTITFGIQRQYYRRIKYEYVQKCKRQALGPASILRSKAADTRKMAEIERPGPATRAVRARCLRSTLRCTGQRVHAFYFDHAPKSMSFSMHLRISRPAVIMMSPPVQSCLVRRTH